MAVKLPSGFTESTKQDVLAKGDELCFIYKIPGWADPYTNVFDIVIDKNPGSRFVTVSHNKKQHYMRLVRAYTSENEIYLIYIAESDVVPVIIVVALVAFLIGLFLGLGIGSLLMIAIRKEAGRLGQTLFTVIIVLVIGIGLWLAIKKWVLKS